MRLRDRFAVLAGCEALFSHQRAISSATFQQYRVPSLPERRTLRLYLSQRRHQASLVAGGCQRVWKNSGVTRTNGFCLMCLACCSSDSTSNFSQKILRTRLTNATLTPLRRFIAGKKLRSDVSSQPRKSRGWRSREGWVSVI